MAMLFKESGMIQAQQEKFKNITIELWCHLVDVLELILAISYNGPQWKIFLEPNIPKSKIIGF